MLKSSVSEMTEEFEEFECYCSPGRTLVDSPKFNDENIEKGSHLKGKMKLID